MGLRGHRSCAQRDERVIPHAWQCLRAERAHLLCGVGSQDELTLALVPVHPVPAQQGAGSAQGSGTRVRLPATPAQLSVLGLSQSSGHFIAQAGCCLGLSTAFMLCAPAFGLVLGSCADPRLTCDPFSAIQPRSPVLPVVRLQCFCILHNACVA